MDNIRTFTAVVTDVLPHRKVEYQWSSSGFQLVMLGAKEKSVTVSCKFPYESSGIMNLFLYVTFDSKKTVTLNYSVPIQGNYSGDYEYLAQTEKDWSELVDEVSVSQSKKVVFFEEGVLDKAYSDIECRYCAKDGGIISLNFSDGDRVCIYDYDGNVVTNGYSWAVNRGSKGVRYFRLAGLRESRTRDGSLVSMIYQPNSGNLVSNSVNVVFAQIVLSTVQDVQPRNRKNLGVRENVNIY